MASMINKSIEYERLNGLLGESPYCLKLWNDNLIVCDSDGSNSRLKLCDCLELMYATGDRTHTRQIVSLYKRWIIILNHSSICLRCLRQRWRLRHTVRASVMHVTMP